jgi:hypothetical protein
MRSLHKIYKINLQLGRRQFIYMYFIVETYGRIFTESETASSRKRRQCNFWLAQNIVLIQHLHLHLKHLSTRELSEYKKKI